MNIYCEKQEIFEATVATTFATQKFNKMKYLKFIYSLAIILPMMVSYAGNGNTQIDCPAKRVVAVSPLRSDASNTRIYSGKVLTRGQISLAFKVGGEISAIKVKEGDRVRKGQTIAFLDSSAYEIGRDAALSQLVQLEQEVGRIRELYKRGSVSKNDLEKAESGLERCRAAYKGEQLKVDYSVLKAPSDGEIVSVTAKAHEMTDAGMQIVSMLQKEQMQVVFDLPESQYPRIKEISDIVCTAGSAAYPMEIAFVSPKADANSLHEARLTFAGNPTGLAPGANVAIKISYESSVDDDEWLSIPVSALFEDGSKSCVWTIDEKGSAIKRVVETKGVPVKGIISVRGLSESDKVVKAGVHHIFEGDSLVIIDSKVPEI